jgi:hypothetical protein
VTFASVPAARTVTTFDTRFSRKLLIALGLAVLADWLFFDRPVGISLALFALALGLGAALAAPARLTRRKTMIGLALLGAGVLPAIEDASMLSALFAAFAVALFAVLLAAGDAGPWRDRLMQAGVLLGLGPVRLVADVAAARRDVRAQGRVSLSAQRLGSWVVPVVLGAVFVGLFAAANPVIEELLAALSPDNALAAMSVWRALFWFAALSFVWPFVHARLTGVDLPRTGLSEAAIVPAPVLRTLFSRGAIFRSLVLFNLLFAVQTVMDAAYLSGAVALPAGQTYAGYAHRGAYPLVATALLAAAFVLITMRPGGAGERSRALRMLVFLWIAQNVALVVSSILRLNLYVATYSLTYWRVAAFIWMGLVAFGLLSIVARIAWARSNGWLIAVNTGALAIALYACAFVNFPLLVGTYNVEHRMREAGRWAVLDTFYLTSLGAQAIPAMDRLIESAPPTLPLGLVQHRNRLAAEHRYKMLDWRALDYRAWRLRAYLEDGRTHVYPGPDTMLK